MRSAYRVFTVGAMLWLGFIGNAGFAQRAPTAARTPTILQAASVRSQSALASPPQDHNAVIRRYCVTCHNDARKTGGLSLVAFDVARAGENEPYRDLRRASYVSQATAACS
jgi:cytochrome c551/c552